MKVADNNALNNAKPVFNYKTRDNNVKPYVIGSNNKD
jgi:hypothetical protein